MSSKKKSTANPNTQTLRIGSRVRCTDDGVEGRITWANAVSVKIKWDDGEEVTWKRDSLPTRPIQILDADAGHTEDQADALPTAGEPTADELKQVELLPKAIEISDTEIPVAELAPEQPQAPATEPAPMTEAQTATTTDVPAEVPAQEPPRVAPAAIDGETTPAPEKPKRQRKAAEPKEKKTSALDAAARVLAEEGRPMTCRELVDVMAARGYWTSPGGATPAATLYSAILREMTTKGAAARFIKTERGKFAFRATA
jgi:hypothetical protein